MKKSLIISLIMVLVVLGLWVTPVKAASASVGISSPSITVEEGKSANVSVTIYFGDKVRGAQCTVNYNKDLFLDSVSISGGARFSTKNNKVIYFSSTNTQDISSVTLTFTTKVGAEGTANFTVSGLNIATTSIDSFPATMSNTSVSTTIKKKVPDQPKPPVTDPEPEKPNGGGSGNNGGSTSSKPNNNTSTAKPTFTGGTATVYAKETVSIRDTWSTSGKLLGTLQKNKSITRTGVASNGWSRVNYNGKTAYISSQYLTTTKPKDDKKDDDKDDDKNNTTNNETNNTVNNTANNEIGNNQINNEENNTTNTNNEMTNAQTNTEQGNNVSKKDNGSEKKVNFVEIAIIAVIIIAILVIIISEVAAKKKSKKKSKR